MRQGSEVRRLARAATVAAGLLVSLGAAAAQQVIDDVTTYSYSQGSQGVGTEADFPVSRTFPGRIVALKVTIVDGKADDIGFVGGMQVTTAPAACKDVGAVTAPVDVTSQVTIQGDTASFVLRAVENCCCSTGWGPATQFDRPPATFHWEVTVDDQVSCGGDNTCRAAECASEATTPNDRTGEFKKTISSDFCKAVGGGTSEIELTLKGTGSSEPLSCGETGCTSKSSVEGEGSIGGSICGIALPDATELSFGLSYDREARHASVCDANCKQACDPINACLTQSGSAKVGVSATLPTKLSFDKHLPLGHSASLKADCGVSLEFSSSVGVAASVISPQGQIDECTQCNTSGITLHNSAAGEAHCDVTLAVGGWEKSIGCEKCGALELAGDIDVQDATGQCENKTCVKTKTELTGSIEVPSTCFHLFGMVMKVGASGKVGGNCTDNTCGETADEIHSCSSAPETTFEHTLSFGPNVKCN